MSNYYDVFGPESERDCTWCDGTGEICCPSCEGAGCRRCLDGQRTCPECKGSGFTQADEPINDEDGS